MTNSIIYLDLNLVKVQSNFKKQAKLTAKQHKKMRDKIIFI